MSTKLVNKRTNKNQKYMPKSSNLQLNNKNHAKKYLTTEQTDAFYDCLPVENEQNKNQQFLQSELQTFALVNQLKNPQKFNVLLEQIAFTAHVLHRGFCRAYRKAKKLNQSQNFCYQKAGKNSAQIFHPDDMSLYELNSQKRVKTKKSLECYSQVENSTCGSFQSWSKEKICPICLGVLEGEKDKFNLKNDTKRVKNFSRDCLKTTNLCQEYGKHLQNLNYSEKYADSCNDLESGQEAKNVILTGTNAVQHFELSPICVTIPLKLRISEQNHKTGIEKESAPGYFLEQAHVQQQTKVSSLPKFKPDPNFSPYLQKTHFEISDNLLAGSGTFYSLNSDSGTSTNPMTGALQQPNYHTSNENILNEILELTKNNFESLKDATDTLARTLQLLKETSESPSKDAPSSLNISSSIKSNTAFTQNAEALTSMPTTPVASPLATSPNFKPEILRTKLFEEVPAALEKMTAKEDLEVLIQSKCLSPPASSPTNLSSQSERLLPDYYQIKPIKPQIPPKPFGVLPLPQLSKLPELASTSQGIIKKPDHSSEYASIPEPPPLPPKFVSEPQQTDFSAVMSSGHNKRNEIRRKVLEELRELSQQSASKTGPDYKAHERDEILQDFNKLIQPFSTQYNREMAALNIRYLIEPDGPTNQALKPSESQATILENIRYILDPKTTPTTLRRKKYNKQIKEKILENLHSILMPREEKQMKSVETRNNILHDLRTMLESGQETNTSSHLGHEFQRKIPDEIKYCLS